MAISPEFSSIQRKEIILKESALLRTFMDRKQLLNYDKWMENLATHIDPIEGEIDDNLGINATGLKVGMLKIAALHQKVFPKIKDSIFYEQIVKSIFLIGHDIGNFKDSELFLTDILITLSKVKLLHPDISSNSVVKEKTIGVIKFFLDCGVYIRDYYTSHALDHETLEQDPKQPGTPSIVELESPPEVADFIKDFINDLPSQD